MPERMPWQIDGWPERKKATWPIEWEPRKFLYEQSPSGWEVRTRSVLRSWLCHNITDHEAACLIREWWRAWLAKGHPGPHKYSWVRPRRVVQHREMFYVQAFFQGDGWMSGRLGKDEFYTTYDEAQAAAVDAVLAEKEKDDAKQDD